jgi:hypothetical protein
MAARVWGWGCGGLTPPPPQRCRSRRQFAETETLIAIMNCDFAGLVLPQQHATLGRRPMLTLPFQLQQTVFVAHHPILAHHALLLQPEHLVQLPRRGPSPVIVGFLRRPLADVAAWSPKVRFEGISGQTANFLEGVGQKLQGINEADQVLGFPGRNLCVVLLPRPPFCARTGQIAT